MAGRRRQVRPCRDRCASRHPSLAARHGHWHQPPGRRADTAHARSRLSTSTKKEEALLGRAHHPPTGAADQPAARRRMVVTAVKTCREVSPCPPPDLVTTVHAPICARTSRDVSGGERRDDGRGGASQPRSGPDRLASTARGPRCRQRRFIARRRWWVAVAQPPSARMLKSPASQAGTEGNVEA